MLNKKEKIPNGFREEVDSLGSVYVPAKSYYKATTKRAYDNFKVGKDLMPIEIIKAIALIKKCSAIANNKIGALSKEKMEAIIKASEAIRIGKLDNEFILPVFQTGSGTATNMNVNEVISEYANKKLKVKLHSNDDVNMCQSTNDVFPSATQIAIVLKTNLKLFPILYGFKDALNRLGNENKNILKIGRTHLQDAVPITLGDEFFCYEDMIRRNIGFISDAIKNLLYLPLGGSAVGNGVNVKNGFSEEALRELRAETDFNFKNSSNKSYGLQSKSNIVHISGALSALGTDLLKIANDLRFLASGPRAGYSEIRIKAGEAGSSIMPGKVNPTQAESLAQVVMDVFGSNQTIIFSASQGNFELNVYKPIIAFHVLRMIDLLSDSILSFNNNLLITIKPNIKKLADNINNTLVTATFLAPKVGYDMASKISKEAFKNNTTIKEEALKLTNLSEEEIDKLLDISKVQK